MKLIVLFWEDGSRNVFDHSRNVDSFIEWKEKKGDVLMDRKYMTREEYLNFIGNLLTNIHIINNLCPT
jgi:hypothetical protein